MSPLRTTRTLSDCASFLWAGAAIVGVAAMVVHFPLIAVIWASMSLVWLLLVLAMFGINPREPGE